MRNLLERTRKKLNKELLIVFLICLSFFTAYSILSIVRFDHYGAFGFDLGLRDQTFWEYSKFKPPITTIHFYPFTSILSDHIELIYIPFAPLFWIWQSPKLILILEPFLVCFSGVAIFLLAKEKKFNTYLSFSLLVSYLSFYGVQNAVWFDVHSVSFATSFLAWFIYFLEKRNLTWIWISFLGAILSKENIASLTFLISFVWYIRTRQRVSILTMFASLLYLFIIFGIYFPHFTQMGYRYANPNGFISNITNIQSFYDSYEKKEVIFYTLSSFGFLALLNPLYLLPAFGDLFNYFVIAFNLNAAQGLYMHYRITLAPLMLWATIQTIFKYKILNNKYIATYLLICAILIQYILHLPLSYLVKNWFWKEPSGIKNINKVIKYLPPNASVVSQNNITPHISERDKIFTLWPEKKDFLKNSPCGNKTCNWFRWVDDPEFLIVDISSGWDIRHLLASRQEFIEGINNIENAGIVKKYKREGSAILYKVIKNP